MAWSAPDLLHAALPVAAVALTSAMAWRLRRIHREVAALRDSYEKTAAAQRQAEHLAAELLRSTTDLLCVIDTSTGAERFNACWENLLGYPPGEMSLLRLEQLIHPDDRAALEAARKSLQTTGGPVGAECRVVAADGIVHWVAWTWTRSPDGRLICQLGRDVTELKRWQQELEYSTRELRQRNQDLADALRTAREATKLKSEFVANTSHEIRTPMNAVVGMTELLLTTPLTAEQREYAEMLRDSARSLLSILNDLLEFSRLEARSAVFDREPFDIRETVSAVIHLLYPRAMASNLTLSCFVTPDIPDILVGDSRRLRQVLLNLVSNAVKFTDEGKVVVRVELVAQSPDRLVVRFEVEDTGIGIAPENQERIFEPFIQAEGSTTRKRGGTGLGLAICRQIVESLGGAIGVTSTLGQGSVFWFTLPFAPARQLAQSPHPHADAPQVSLVGRHVLLVEDNAVNQHLTRRLLEKEGCKVEIAASGPIALDLIQRSRYDLILMDVQMPDMDGLETTIEIRRRQSSQSRTPIIALTANAMDGDREACFAAGMDDYLSKPVSRESLRQALQRWMPLTPARLEPPAPTAV